MLPSYNVKEWSQMQIVKKYYIFDLILVTLGTYWGKLRLFEQ